MAEQDPTGTPPKTEERVYTQQESAQAAAELQAYKALEGRSARRKRTKNLRIAIIVVVATITVVLGLVFLKSLAKPQIPTMPPPIDYVTRGDFVDSIQASGNLVANEQVTITPEVDGTVAELYIQEGDTVEKGQLLFTLDNPMLDQSIIQAQRGVDSANLSLRGAQTARNDAGAAADRTWQQYQLVKQAYEDSLLIVPEPGQTMPEGIPTEADVEMAYQSYRAAQMALESSKLSLESAQMSVSDANRMLRDAIETAGKRNVYSPISGQVVVMNLERGMKLSSLMSTGKVAAQIADVSQMRMTISISEIDILSISPGMKAVVSVDAIPGYRTDAEVLRVASTSGGGSDMMYYGYGGGGLVYYSVELQIPSPDPRLKIGMSAGAEIISQRMNNVLMVTSMAVQFDGESSYVEVYEDDGSTRIVIVEVLATSTSQVVIAGDVKDGDKVILNFMGGGMGGGMDGGVVRPMYAR